jgi:hypothetical protein
VRVRLLVACRPVAGDLRAPRIPGAGPWPDARAQLFRTNRRLAGRLTADAQVRATARTGRRPQPGAAVAGPAQRPSLHLANQALARFTSSARIASYRVIVCFSVHATHGLGGAEMRRTFVYCALCRSGQPGTVSVTGWWDRYWSSWRAVPAETRCERWPLNLRPSYTVRKDRWPVTRRDVFEFLARHPRGDRRRSAGGWGVGAVARTIAGAMSVCVGPVCYLVARGDTRCGHRAGGVLTRRRGGSRRRGRRRWCGCRDAAGSLPRVMRTAGSARSARTGGDGAGDVAGGLRRFRGARAAVRRCAGR